MPVNDSQASLMKKALAELKRLRAELGVMKKAVREPIAIIGMGCRFPGGADDPERFWELLHDGRDAIGNVPPDRWDVENYYDADPDAAGKMYTRHGGFLGPLDGFDAPFFGISPREAASLDPKQRLVLEVGWECLENAGLPPDRLYGSRTGVYVGIGNFDYLTLQLRVDDPAAIDTYFTTGGSLCVAAGRLSYVLGLIGPSMIVDTACSSSLVAVHLACRALRQRECDLALAGGVNSLLAPEVSVNFCRARMLSADGRCKVFDADADGYVRAEGCGIVALKRLSEALADGDIIQAVIRGSAVNQDGASGGLAVPSGPSQEKVIREALADGDLTPDAVDYVEAHGTGTALGDPIELEALGQVFGRRETDLVVGSVKSNIGHAEPAAGISGLIKTVLALGHDRIPANLHFNRPNSKVDWARLKVTIPTRPVAWPRGERARVAGVSSFGFSGTNAHVVVAEAPADDAPSRAPGTDHLLVLSARSASALADTARRHGRHLVSHPDLVAGAVAFTAATGRTHFNHRLAVVADSPAAFGRELERYTSGGVGHRVITGRADAAIRPVFFFSGRFARDRDAGMLPYDTQPVFRETLERCGELLDGRLERPLPEILSPLFDGRPPAAPMDAATAQPVLFALGCGLADLWRAWGIQPEVLMGHGAGIFAAARTAGVFSLDDGIRLVVAIGRLMAGGSDDAAAMAAFQQVLEEITFTPPRIPLISPHTGEPVPAETAGSVFWGNHVRESEAFASQVEDLVAREQEVVAAMDQTPVRCRAARPEESGTPGHRLLTMQPGQGWPGVLRRLGRFYVHGGSVNWPAVYGDTSARRVTLPTYPFQRRRHWIPTGDRPRVAAPAAARPAGPVENAPSRAGLYEIIWQSLTSAAAADCLPGPAGQWLIFADRGGVGQDLATRLETVGRQCRLVFAGLSGTGPDDRERLDPAVMQRLLRETAPVAGVVYAWGLDLADGFDPAASLGILQAALFLIQAIIKRRDGQSPGIWLATRGARAAGGDDRLPAVGQSPLWGLGRAVALEHPDLPCTLVDLDPSDGAGNHRAGQCLFDALGVAGVSQMAWRGGRCRVPRLIPSPTATPPGSPAVALRRDGTYMVSGGLGGLGLSVARWMAEQGAGHIVLTGRHRPGKAALLSIEAIEAAGAAVTVAQGDIALEADVAALMETIQGGMPPLRGMIHAAGVLEQGRLVELTADRLTRVMAPKAAGAWYLHRATRAMKLDFFVMFSSAATVLGYLGKGAYVAASAVLDALAHHRHALGLPAATIGWGPWAGAGMATGRIGERERALDWGMRYIEPDTGMALLAQVLIQGCAQCYAMDIDWQRYTPLLAPADRRGIFEKVGVETHAAAGRATPAALPAIVDDLRRTPAAQRPVSLLKALHALAGTVLGTTVADDIAVDQPLMEQGFDSMMAVEMKNRLQRQIGVDLPVSMLFDYPTLEKLRNFLLTDVIAFEDVDTTMATNVREASDGASASLLDEIETLIASG